MELQCIQKDTKIEGGDAKKPFNGTTWSTFYQVIKHYYGYPLLTL
jgi:hypothetical protein